MPRGEFPLRVHSVFRGALNLRLEGRDLLITLLGAGGPDGPQAIRLGTAPDFRTWGVVPGARGYLGRDALILETGPGGSVGVDLSRAQRLAPLPLPPIRSLGPAFEACVRALEAEQLGRACDLRIAPLLAGDRGDGRAADPGGRLVEAAWDLGAAAARLDAEQARLAACRLVGLGAGSTPAGDDFLCGFLAALRCAAHGRSAPLSFLDGLCQVVAALLPTTTDLGANALRCALRALVPAPLGELAAALAAGRIPEALEGLRRACAQGHSSGADLCTGFLHGLSLWAGADAGWTSSVRLPSEEAA
ncbi:MAG TPA: DUF2877 domain-containing protein [Anaeromyxobacter sp.]|nr:DUF2877 domain-containing protein [Anaeromyxobacter sp.]